MDSSGSRMDSSCASSACSVCRVRLRSRRASASALRLRAAALSLSPRSVRLRLWRGIPAGRCAALPTATPRGARRPAGRSCGSRCRPAPRGSAAFLAPPAGCCRTPSRGTWLAALCSLACSACLRRPCDGCVSGLSGSRCFALFPGAAGGAASISTNHSTRSVGRTRCASEIPMAARFKSRDLPPHSTRVARQSRGRHGLAPVGHLSTRHSPRTSGARSHDHGAHDPFGHGHASGHALSHGPNGRSCPSAQGHANACSCESAQGIVTITHKVVPCSDCHNPATGSLARRARRRPGPALPARGARAVPARARRRPSAARGARGRPTRTRAAQRADA